MTSLQQPLVSVLISTYNNEKTILQQLKAFYPDIKILKS